MSITLFLHILWKRLALLLSPGSIRIDGLWDRARLRTESNQELKAWKNVLLLHPRREALNNGVVVTKVEHLKDGSQHEFLRIHVLHEKSKERLAFIVDREVWPKDLKGPPDTNGEAEETEKPSLSSKKNRRATELEPSTGDEHDEISQKKDVPEERGLSLMIIPDSGKIVHCSEPFFPAHKALDRVHRGVGDLEKRMSLNILELQTLAFPECSRPSVINIAFFLAALSEFAPQYHVGEYQGYWFARAACDGLHATFRGRLKPGSDTNAMGKWKAASFKYTNPWASIAAEYNRQLKDYEDAFKIIQLAGHQLADQQLGLEGLQLGVEEGRQEGIAERRKLEDEIQQRMVERRQLEEEIAKLRADLAGR